MQPYILMKWSYFHNGIKNNLNIITQIQGRIESVEKEESKIREDIHKMMIESKIEHGVLSQRLVEIDGLDKTLMELCQDLLSMETHSKKIAPEKRT